MKKLIPLLFILLACQNKPKCTTFCGLQLLEPSEWTCDEFNDAMHVAIKELTYEWDGGVRDYRFADVCYRIQGYQITVRPVSYWINPDDGFETTGTTSCWNAEIELTNQAPLKGSFAHELAHAIQNCEPKSIPCKTNQLKDGGTFDMMHNCWVEDGIFSAIDRYQNQDD